MRILKKITSVLLTALMVQSVAVTGTVMTTSAYQIDKTDSQTQTQKTVSTDTVYSDFEYSVSDNKVTVTKYTGTDTEVVIPSEIDGLPVTAIGNNTFQDSAQTITGVTIPQSVTSIGNYAFYSCFNLTSVIIPDNVVSIGDYAFCATGLTSVTIPENVTSIGLEAFGECGNLTSINVNGNNINYSDIDGILFNKNQTEILCYPCGKTDTSYTIPNTVTNIGDFAFICCHNLTSVTIPTSVTYIGMGAIYNCNYLRDIYYTGSREQWQMITISSAVDYWLTYVTIHYNYNDFEYSVSDGKVTITKYNGNDTEVVIPSEINGLPVTAIGDNAFEDCNMLESLTIPISITEIYSLSPSMIRELHYQGSMIQWQQINGYLHADKIFFTYGDFEYFDYLGITIAKYNGNETHVVIPSEIDGMPVHGIYSYTFRDCTTVESVTIPENIIENGMVIEEEAFFTECGNLTTIYFGGTHTQFVQAYQRGWDINIPNIYFQYEDFEYSCGYLYDVETHSEKFGIGITKYNGNADTVTVPSEIDRLPVLAVGNYSYPSFTPGQYTFENCDNLESVIFPKSAVLYYNVFSNCNNLKSVTGYKGLCPELFYDCYNLQELHFLGSYSDYEGNYYYNSFVTMYFIADDFEYTIVENSGVKITKYTGTDSNVTIPSCMDEMPYSYSNLPITIIGAYAFEGRYLESITIPATITTIEPYAFYNSLLNDVYYASSQRHWNELTADTDISTMFTDATIHYGILTYNDFEYIIDNNEITITQYIGNDEQVIIPGTIDGIPVKNIGRTSVSGDYPLDTWNAFAYCNSLKSVTIPDGVTNIGSCAFYNCSNLTSVNIPDSVTNIGSWAFLGCSNLTSVNIPGNVTTIGSDAFANCRSLTSVDIPDSVTTIGSNAFRNCDSLTSINVDSNNTQYASEDGILFDKAKTELMYYPARKTNTSYSIPDSVSRIAEYAFKKCDSLTNVTMSQNMTVIGSYAFDDCSNLTSVTVFSGLTNVWYCAFDDCKNLKDVYYAGSQTQWQSIKIRNGNDYLTNATIHYNNTILSLDKEELALEVGQMYTLTAKTIPETETTFTFKSNNTAVATVNGSGRVVARGEGTATITAISSDGKKIYCTVTVSQKKEIVLDKTELNLSVKEQYTLTPSMSPEDTSVTYTFKSNNTAVATVNKAGRIVARGEGTATITVIGSNGLKAYCTVNVSPQKVLVLDKTELTLALKEQYTLTPSVIPEDTEVTYTFKSDNTTVATVNKAGRIVGRATGTANIKVIASNGLTAICTVMVE